MKDETLMQETLSPGVEAVLRGLLRPDAPRLQLDPNSPLTLAAWSLQMNVQLSAQDRKILKLTTPGNDRETPPWGRLWLGLGWQPSTDGVQGWTPLIPNGCGLAHLLDLLRPGRGPGRASTVGWQAARPLQSGETAPDHSLPSEAGTNWSWEVRAWSSPPELFGPHDWPDPQGPDLQPRSLGRVRPSPLPDEDLDLPVSARWRAALGHEVQSRFTEVLNGAAPDLRRAWSWALHLLLATQPGLNMQTLGLARELHRIQAVCAALNRVPPPRALIQQDWRAVWIAVRMPAGCGWAEVLRPSELNRSWMAESRDIDAASLRAIGLRIISAADGQWWSGLSGAKLKSLLKISERDNQPVIIPAPDPQHWDAGRPQQGGDVNGAQWKVRMHDRAQLSAGDILVSLPSYESALERTRHLHAARRWLKRTMESGSATDALHNLRSEDRSLELSPVRLTSKWQLSLNFDDLEALRSSPAALSGAERAAPEDSDEWTIVTEEFESDGTQWWPDASSWVRWRTQHYHQQLKSIKIASGCASGSSEPLQGSNLHLIPTATLQLLSEFSAHYPGTMVSGKEWENAQRHEASILEELKRRGAPAAWRPTRPSRVRPYSLRRGDRLIVTLPHKAHPKVNVSLEDIGRHLQLDQIIDSQLTVLDELIPLIEAARCVWNAGETAPLTICSGTLRGVRLRNPKGQTSTKFSVMGTEVSALRGGAKWASKVVKLLKKCTNQYQRLDLNIHPDSELAAALQGPRPQLAGKTLHQSLSQHPRWTEAWLCQLSDHPPQQRAQQDNKE